MADAEEHTRTDRESTRDPQTLEPLVAEMFENVGCLPSMQEFDERAIEALGPSISQMLRARLEAQEAEPAASSRAEFEQYDRADGCTSAEDSPEFRSPQGETVAPSEELRSTMRNEYGSTREVSLPDESLTREGPPPRVEPADSEIARLGRTARSFYVRRRIGRRGYTLRRLLGVGGQGRVYLTRCGGADGFQVLGALKVFSPHGYRDLAEYETAMRRIARVARRVAQERHPNLVEVSRFEQSGGVRLMLMELLNGYDLRRLLNPRMHEYLQGPAPTFVNRGLLDEFNEVLVTTGPDQPRMMPGAAVALIRDCLNALDALHEMDILHFDIKPSNIMVTRGGHAKLIDLGSAILLKDPGTWRDRIFTLAYAAPEVLERKEWTRRSDLASLGYVLVELMSGRRLFQPDQAGQPRLTRDELLARKRALPGRLETLFPQESPLLLEFCRKLIAVDPADRFATARAADSDPHCGAAAFHRQLVWGRLDTIWPLNIKLWIETIKAIERHTAAEPRGAEDAGEQ